MDLPCFEFGTVHMNFKGFQCIKIQKLNYHQYGTWLYTAGKGLVTLEPRRLKVNVINKIFHCKKLVLTQCNNSSQTENTVFYIK
jgi:hypothetical protein